MEIEWVEVDVGSRSAPITGGTAGAVLHWAGPSLHAAAVVRVPADVVGYGGEVRPVEARGWGPCPMRCGTGDVPHVRLEGRGELHAAECAACGFLIYSPSGEGS